MAIHSQGITPEQLNLKAFEERYPMLQYHAKEIATNEEAREIRGSSGRYVTFTGNMITEANLVDSNTTGIKFIFQNRKLDDVPVTISYKGYNTVKNNNGILCEIELYKDKIFSFTWNGEYWIPNEELYYNVISDFSDLSNFYPVSDTIIIVDSDTIVDPTKTISIIGMTPTVIGSEVIVVNSKSDVTIPIEFGNYNNKTNSAVLPKSYTVLTWTGEDWVCLEPTSKQTFMNPDLTVNENLECIWVINHNFNKDNLNTQVYYIDETTNEEKEIFADVKNIDRNTTVITFISDSNISANSYKAIIF